MKVKIEAIQLNLLFNALQEHNYKTIDIANYLGKNRRTVTDWKRGKFNMSDHDFHKLVKIACLESEKFQPVYIDEIERRRETAKIGGIAQWRKNGSIGSTEDRIKGGKNSYLSRKTNSLDIFTRNIIIKPQRSSKLAEFIGISMGDGSITDYQIIISLNNEDDTEYITFVVKFVKKLFGLDPKLHKRKHSKCTNIVLSSIELVEFLVKKGLPKGDKIRGGLNIPEWIFCDDNLLISCIRGLFDTDGSVYLETHMIKGNKYSYPRWSFVSASAPLRQSVFEGLIRLGFEPKIRMNRSVNLERFTDIDKYFKMIGSSNPKHLQKIALFGGVG